MSLLHFYVRKRKVIIPTVVQAADGFYMDSQPVEIIDLRNLEGLKQSLLTALKQGNPQVPTPETTSQPGSPVLEAVGIRRWEAFEKGSALYTVHCSTQAVTVYATGRGDDGMWTQGHDRQQLFNASTPLTIVVEALIADMLSRPDLNEGEPGVPMLLPPTDIN